MSKRVTDYLTGQKAAILERMLTLIRFPSVSTDPAFGEGMRGARDFLLDRLHAIGLSDFRLLEAPSIPPAPGRFSMIAGLPREACMPSAVSRAQTSVAPPGGKGTTKRTGRSGAQACGCARPPAGQSPKGSAASNSRRDPRMAALLTWQARV